MDEDLVQRAVYPILIIITLWVTWKVLKKKPQGNLLTVFRWSGLLLLTIVNIFFLVMSVNSITTYIENYPRKATTLMSLSLGMSYQDVLFIKGKPSVDLDLKDVEDKKKFNVMIYKDTDNNIDAIIGIDEENKVELISNPCTTIKQRYERLHGISCGAELPIKRLESYEKFEATSEDGLVRRYCYPELGTCYWGEKGQVTHYSIYLHDNYPTVEW